MSEGNTINTVWNLLSLIYKINDNNLVCKTSLLNLKQFPISRWKGQRPPDSLRIKEIYLHIKREKYIDGIIYLYYDKQQNCFFCYDGLHRLEALRTLINENYTDQLNILLSIRRNVSQGEIMDHFNSLNKCIPVPDIYTGIRNASIITTIESVVNLYVAKYPQHFSTSRNPNTPNENKDRLKDRLSFLIENNTTELELDSEGNLISILETINEHVRNNIPRKSTRKQLEKCQASGLYIFLMKEWHHINI
jgi:hypothetical protein